METTTVDLAQLARELRQAARDPEYEDHSVATTMVNLAERIEQGRLK